MLDFRIISATLSKTSIALKDESDIWILSEKSSVQRLLSSPQNSTDLLKRCVYEADREGDEYDLMISLQRMGVGFSIRSQ